MPELIRIVFSYAAGTAIGFVLLIAGFYAVKFFSDRKWNREMEERKKAVDRRIAEEVAATTEDGWERPIHPAFWHDRAHRGRKVKK